MDRKQEGGEAVSKQSNYLNSRARKNAGNAEGKIRTLYFYTSN